MSKKMMKRIAALMLLVMIPALAACGSTKAEAQNVVPSEPVRAEAQVLSSAVPQFADAVHTMDGGKFIHENS